jgi:hypothetical protein
MFHKTFPKRRRKEQYFVGILQNIPNYYRGIEDRVLPFLLALLSFLLKNSVVLLNMPKMLTSNY